MFTEAHILRALRDCYDPEIPLNLVELGLVEHITLTPDPEAPGAGIPGVPDRYRVNVSLLSATADEAVAAQLQAIVHNRLAGIFELSGISVTILDAPKWTPARITPEGRKLLGMDQPQFPILNNKVRPDKVRQA